MTTKKKNAEIEAENEAKVEDQPTPPEQDASEAPPEQQQEPDGGTPEGEGEGHPAKAEEGLSSAALVGTTPLAGEDRNPGLTYNDDDRG